MEINLEDQKRYFRMRYAITAFKPAGDDFKWFCKFVTEEDWWPEFVQLMCDRYAKTTVLTCDLLKHFLNAQEFVDAVYLFLIERDGITEGMILSENQEQPGPPAPVKECPLRPPGPHVRCPQCEG